MSKSEKMYFSEHNPEFCYPLDYFEDAIKDGEERVILMEAVKVVGEGHMWCAALGECLERGNGDCGKHCQYYAPCNGVSGRCRELKNSYRPSKQKLLLTKNGLEAVA